ncbi:MAG: DUF1501 domain-containing protein, partial [Pirellula sp.]
MNLWNTSMPRRDWLQWANRGVGATAALAMLTRDGVLRAADGSPANNRPARAKRAIQICLVGGLSHLDSMDYKPELDRLHGKTLNTTEKPDIFFGQMGLLR